MDKKQFVDEMINEVRTIPVSSVLSTRMELIRKGGYYKGLCPFHPDRTIGSFVATDGKQVWKCFSCGVGGDSIKFVSLYDNINYLEAAFRIALDFGIISSYEYEEYFERRRYRKEEIRRIEKRFEEIDRAKWQNNIADEDTLHEVFSLFIGCANLSDEHKEHLMKERGLTEEEIQEGMYFTFPTRRIMPIFRKKLEDKFDVDILARIPGFYKDLSTNLYTFVRHKGIGIPIKNAKGKIVGIQIRHDEKKDKSNRYVWFSSSFAMYERDKYDCGTSSGSPVDVVYPKEIRNNTICITEGRFKAQQLAKETGSIVISVQGVGSWKGVLKELQSIPFSPIVKERYKKGKPFRVYCILVAFDSDMNYKYQVFQQLRKMTDQLEEHGYPVYYLNWDESFGKGIDDVLLSGNRHVIKRYDKEIWDKTYQNMIRILLENEPYKEIREVPEEVIKKYFHQYMNIPALQTKELSKKHRLMLNS